MSTKKSSRFNKKSSMFYVQSSMFNVQRSKLKKRFKVQSSRKKKFEVQGRAVPVRIVIQVF